MSLEGLTENLSQALSTADSELRQVLPIYMIPTAYIPIKAAPILISGKIDRKQLRQFAASVDVQRLDHQPTKETRGLNPTEQSLCSAWSTILGIEIESISLDSNFFALGGDSVLAMKLVPICRAQGLDLGVADVFANPVLSSMALSARNVSTRQREGLAAFALCTEKDVSIAKLEAARLCDVHQNAIIDIFPCTPIQQSEITFSLKSETPYMAQRIATIPAHISIEEWKAAWDQVYATHPMLRTRMIQLGGNHFSQVVLDDKIEWKGCEDLDQYLGDDRSVSVHLGQRMARFAIITSEAANDRYMVWTMHHAIYDGWSEPIILEDLRHALDGQALNTTTPMQDFVQFLQLAGDIASKDYWKTELEGATGPQFPPLPHRDYVPTQDTVIERTIKFPPYTGSYTIPTFIRAAWALVVCHYTGNSDVIFGETLSGRDISLAGVESIIGPLIATIPVRIPVSFSMTVAELLCKVQEAAAARTPYQHMGMQNIRLVSVDAQIACETGTGLVIQPQMAQTIHELGFKSIDSVREALNFNPYPLMLACGLGKEGFRVCAGFDSTLIKAEHLERMLAQLEVTCTRMMEGPSVLLGEVPILDDNELDLIWRHNKTAPLAIDESTGTFCTTAVQKGSLYPPVTVPWVCSVHNPSLLLPSGCIGELWLEGNFLPATTINTPLWLQAGSCSHPGRTGKVIPTGDLVCRDLDGQLTFMGRRQNQTLIQGHNVDIAELDSHLSRYLSTKVKHTVLAITVEKASSSKPALLAYIETDAATEPALRLLEQDYEVDSAEENLWKIHANITHSLSHSLHKFDEFCRVSLQPHMRPSYYLIGSGLLLRSTKDIDKLTALLAKIPAEVLSRVWNSLQTSWDAQAAKLDLTREQATLRRHWSELLSIDASRIGLEDSFFRLGGDSVIAMKLVATLRKDNFDLATTDVFKHMQLRAMAGSMKPRAVPQEETWRYEAFSALPLPNAAHFISTVVQPQLGISQWQIQDAYPVTDLQSLDIRATINAPQTSIQYTALYLSGAIDEKRFERAWQQLVVRHDILRTIFMQHDEHFYSVVVSELDLRLVVSRTEASLEATNAELCAKNVESGYRLGTSFVRAFLIQDVGSQSCFLLGLSHAQYDGVSLPFLLQDLEALYEGNSVQSTSSFGAYVAQTRQASKQVAALQYWRGLLDGSVMTQVARTLATDQATFCSQVVELSGRPEHITIATLLSSAWAVVLARYLGETDICFGSVTSGRSCDALTGAYTAVGPCYQFTPVRVNFGQTWTAIELLDFVQAQSLESAAHDFVGFNTIAEQCTSWKPTDNVFGSVVHYQEADEDKHSSFAGLSCKADVIKPHGDAATPMKVVTYVEGGKTYVGIVGSEKVVSTIQTLLDQLVVAIHELADQSKHILLLSPSDQAEKKTDSPLAMD